MMKFRENEDAVSPVIGVILMVAITVILAAVIAAFVFGMSDNIPAQKEVYVTVTQGSDGTDAVLTVTIQGGKDVSALKQIEYIDANDATNKDTIDFGDLPFKIGDSGKITLKDTGTQHYIIRGIFSDNSVKILAEKDYVAPEAETPEGGA